MSYGVTNQCNKEGKSVLVNTMKAYLESRCTALHIRYLDTWWWQAVSFTFQLHYTQERTVVPLNMRLQPLSWSAHFEEEKYNFLLPGFKSWIIQPVT
jgi:hypothetical protein